MDTVGSSARKAEPVVGHVLGSRRIDNDALVARRVSVSIHLSGGQGENSVNVGEKQAMKTVLTKAELTRARRRLGLAL